MNAEELMIKCVVEGRSFPGFFSIKNLQSVVGEPEVQLRYAVKKLIAIRAFKKMESSNRGAMYTVSEGAIQKVKHYINAEKKTSTLPQVDDLGCGIVWVKKANAEGMGNSLLRRFDNLLSGVR